MKPPKFTDDELIQDIKSYTTEKELKLYNMGWRKTTSGHYTDNKTHRLDKDHEPVGYEVGQINMNIPVSDADHLKRVHNAAIKTNAIIAKKKSLKDRTQALLNSKLTNRIMAKYMECSVDDIKELGLEGADVGTFISYNLALSTTKGNAKAAEYLRDTAGEKPVNTQEISVFTDADKELCRKLAARMGINDEEPQ